VMGTGAIGMAKLLGFDVVGALRNFEKLIFAGEGKSA